MTQEDNDQTGERRHPNAPDPDDIAIAYEMWQDNQSFRAIGRRLGRSHITAQDYVRRAREAEYNRTVASKARAREDLTDVVRELAARYMMLLGSPPDPEDWRGVDQAIERVTKVGPRLEKTLDMFARLTGAYAATQVELSNVQTTPAQNAISAAIKRRNAEREARERQEIDDARRARNRPELEG